VTKEGLRVLVVSYFFPPFNRVGGRRWAKHAKYFNSLGLPFFVLAGDYEGSSPWDTDILAFRDKIFRIKNVELTKPFFLRALPVNIFQKVRWKLSYHARIVSESFLSGNFNDASRKSENLYFEKAEDIIRSKNINTIILSTGPFYYSKILIKLRSRFPNLKIILDYRDYWEDGYGGLTERQIKQEKNLQRKVINCVDLILSPNMEMQMHYSKTFNKPSFLLPHCVDEDDMGNLPVKTGGKNVQLLYGGAFYENIGQNLELIKKFIDQMNQLQPVVADFFVSVKGYEKEMRHPLLNRHEFVESRIYFEKVIQSDYVILILPSNRVNAMSSKFFELIALRRPILYFGGEGEVSRFILMNKLGFHITEKNLTESVNICLTNRMDLTIPDPGYDIHQHTFGYQTEKLISQLQQL